MRNTVLHIEEDLEPAGPRAEFRDPGATIRFMLAGNAYVTFQSERTGTRFTYRIQQADGVDVGRAPHFVALLVGPDNSRSYQFLGTIFRRSTYRHGHKSRIDPDASSAIAFEWVWRTLSVGKMHPELAVYHEGRCGKCSRRLTTPRSISIGLGPTCEARSGR